MVYEVEFSTQENGEYETIHTAMIHALSVTECQGIADDIANSINPSDKSLLVGIGELAE